MDASGPCWFSFLVSHYFFGLVYSCATPTPAAEAVVAGPRFQCIRGAAANIRDNHTITNVYTDMSSI